ncbi:hypothetical protein [Streptomyces sp. NPDC001435]|uniref:hypothetical protein n=1 Tax=Streptomyces sp. NPDC001435 TaxID=3364576 RepID=UPI0036D04FAC
MEPSTPDEVPDRHLGIDRTVAFLPADDVGRLALEVGRPALLRFFTAAFGRLGRPATPMRPQAVRRPRPERCSPTGWA